MNNYSPVIEFNIFHDYFIEGRCKDLELDIARNKKKLLNNYQMVFKKNSPWQYVLYIDSANNFEDRARMLESDMMEDLGLLSFIITANKQGFFSYTKDVGISSTNHLIDIPIEYIDDIENPINYEFKNYKRTSVDPQFEKEIFKIHPTALAFITFRFPNNSDQTIFQMVNNSRTLKVNLSFEAKSAYWRYVLLPRASKEPELSITDANQLINFSEIEWIMVDDDLKAGVAFSRKEIKFSERYPFHLQLWKNHFNGKGLITDQLSLPDPEKTGNYFQDEQMKNFISIYQYF